MTRKKTRHLARLLLTWVVACIGPFFWDFKNNDASTMNKILLQNTDNTINWLEEVIFLS